MPDTETIWPGKPARRVSPVRLDGPRGAADQRWARYGSHDERHCGVGPHVTNASGRKVLEQTQSIFEGSDSLTVRLAYGSQL
jgi:hypothetical protein